MWLYVYTYNREHAAVCHNEPDSKKDVDESDASVFFLFIQTQFCFCVPLGSTVAFNASILPTYISVIASFSALGSTVAFNASILPTYISVIASLCGAKLGVSPPERSPLCV